MNKQNPGAELRNSSNDSVLKCYIVPGQPHILLAPEKSAQWQALHNAFGEIRAEIESLNADLILYFSTQWLSVLGYMFQADPEPVWSHVDPNWHDLGVMDYKFKVDSEFAGIYAREVKQLGYTTRLVNYKGFPIDTGTIVAQKLLNPDNRLKAAMVSCNMYAEKTETLSIGQAAIRALQKSGRRAVVVVVSNLSNRYETKPIDPKLDKVSSLKDDEWNRKILELLGEGRLEDVSEVAREFSRQANADMNGKGIWWLNGLCGKSNKFDGKIFGYGPVWGTGCALVGLTPLFHVAPQADWSDDEFDLTKRFGVSTTAGANSTGGTSASGGGDATKAESTRLPKGEIMAKSAPEPVGAYPHARRVGDFLFLSGVGPRERGSKQIPGVQLNAAGEVTGHDVEVQTRAVIENVRTILLEAGASLENVIDVQVFLTNMKRDFAKFNKIYGDHFAAIGPTRTTVEVGSLPTPIAVEFKVIAYIPN